MIVVGYDLPSSRAAVELAEEHPGLWAAVGVHPHEAATLERDALGCLRTLAKRERVVAVGETGLDFHYNFSKQPDQRRVFATQLKLAAELNLPVIVHSRNAFDEAALLAEARRTAGFDDFGDDGFLAPLRVLLTSLAEEAPLNAVGRATMRGVLARRTGLHARLRALE